jgi:hypothetical protein
MGGMGVLYLCEDAALNRTVCLKILPPWLTELPRALERFHREAEIVARLVTGGRTLGRRVVVLD